MDLVEIDRRGAVAHLTLNAPSSINALSDAMLAALKARLEEIAAGDAKVVILKGAGKAFCAGGMISRRCSLGARALIRPRVLC